MRKIEFHNREREIKEIRNILDTRPTLITFIYGPINSGKTELIGHVIEELPSEYVVFYINLRGKFISSYKDFVRALFKLEREKKEYKEILKTLSEVSLKSLKFTGIPITESVLDLFFREKTYEDVFEFLEDYFTEIAANKVPVLIVDELQKIGDVKIDTYLIYELFNLFIRLTKELHLCHVFAVSSDSLFIERVYSEAMLEGRCRYLLVDDFDEGTTKEFLEEQGFNDKERAMAWHYCGGKPGYLVELANTKLSRGNIAEKAEVMLEEEISRLIFLLARNKEKKSDIVDMLAIFAPVEEVKYTDSMDLDLLSFLVKQNILFLDPVKRTIKPQSRLNLLAIREVMKNG